MNKKLEGYWETESVYKDGKLIYTRRYFREYKDRNRPLKDYPHYSETKKK